VHADEQKSGWTRLQPLGTARDMPRPKPPRHRRRPPKLPVYRGAWGPVQAERLLWRAGFGPRRGDRERFAKLGLEGSVRALTHPPAERLRGPKPTVDGAPIAPGDAWGHDVLWWLDRMVRSNQPLTERLTLVFHDWFATSISGASARHLLAQNRTLRANCMGSFQTLTERITRDPAMLMWLNGTDNSKDSPNENYARELQELFTLGAGNGYTERDVRELARALTGWRNDWSDNTGAVNFRYDGSRHDGGTKTVYGRRGRYTWQDAVRLAIEHRSHPAFFVGKLWGYFIPTAPSRADVTALSSLYVRSGHKIRPVVEAILRHPAMHRGPRMVKPPIVYVAGLLRGAGKGVDTDAWAWATELAGQRPFAPPNVAGWDAGRWIDTATWRGRWICANHALEGRTLDPDPDKTKYPTTAAQSPAGAVDAALKLWGSPTVTAATRRELERFAKRCDQAADAEWKQGSYSILRHNALAMLIATSPDLHTC
jgi:uncharacterized protein (DUF1800 family)